MHIHGLRIHYKKSQLALKFFCRPEKGDSFEFLKLK